MASTIGHVIEGALCVAPFVGIPVLCWLDPAGHYAAEVSRRQAERQESQG